MLDNIKTSIWISALIRRAEAGGAFAHVVKKGDMDFGSTLLKILSARGIARLLSPSRNMAGEIVWVDLSKGITHDEFNEPEIDEYIEKRVKQDSDLWVIEIEDTKGRDFLTEKVE